MKRSLRHYLDTNLYGVCSYLGEKLNIPSSRIRLYFIYVSFFTIGSPIILYMTLAFMLQLKNYTRRKRNAIWDF